MTKGRTRARAALSRGQSLPLPEELRDQSPQFLMERNEVAIELATQMNKADLARTLVRSVQRTLPEHASPMSLRHQANTAWMFAQVDSAKAAAWARELLAEIDARDTTTASPFIRDAQCYAQATIASDARARKDLQQAAISFTHALELCPDEPRLRETRAMFLVRRAQTHPRSAAAAQDFAAARDHVAAGSPAEQARVELAIADAASHAGQQTTARATYARAAALLQTCDAPHLLARAHAGMHRSNRAPSSGK